MQKEVFMNEFIKSNNLVLMNAHSSLTINSKVNVD